MAWVGMRRAAAIAATVIGVVVALAAPASASTPASAPASAPMVGSWGGQHPGCASGQATGHGTTVIDSFRFALCRTGPDPHDVRGRFAAAGNFGTGALIAPQGPVTCAAFHGDTVSFLYPLEGNRPPFPPDATAILIVAKAGGPGVGKIGFIGPAPAATFANSCAPSSPQALAASAAALPLTTGSISVEGPA